MSVGHELRTIERLLVSIYARASALLQGQGKANDLLASIDASLKSIDAKTPVLPDIQATGGTLTFSTLEGDMTMADTFNPGTPVLGNAAFTKPDPANPGGVLPGQIDGVATPVVLTGTINWLDTVDIEATGGTLTLTAAPAPTAAAKRK